MTGRRTAARRGQGASLRCLISIRPGWRLRHSARLGGASAVSEEAGEEGGGGLGEDAGGDGELVVKAGVVEDLEGGAVGPGFGVVRGVDEAGDSGVEDGAGTHGAGLERADQGAAGEAVVTEGEAGGAESDDLGVGCGVGGTEDLVVAGAEEGEAVGGKDEGTDGDLAGELGEAGLLEGEEHEGFVGEGHGCVG